MSVYLPLEILARRHDVDPLWLAWWCRTGRIEARRLGGRWVIDPDSLAAYLASRSSSGLQEEEPLRRWSRERPRLALAVAGAVLVLLVILGRSTTTSIAPVGLAAAPAAAEISTTVSTTDWGLISAARWLRGWWLASVNLVFRNWYGWITGRARDDEQTLTDISRLTRYLEIREQLKREIITELSRGLRNETSPVAAGASAASAGIVVVPAAADDPNLQARLASMFSDPVDVSFDDSGVSGTITPIFRGTNERGDYIFVLTPIRSR